MPSTVFFVKAITAALLLAIIVGLGLFAYKLLKSDAPESLARVYPESTLAFGWLATSPTASSAGHLRTILNRANELEERQSDIQSELSEAFNVDIGRIREWLGEEVAFGMAADGRSLTLTARVKDRDKAAVTVQEIANETVAMRSAKYERAEDGDFEVWSVESGAHAVPTFALSDRLFIVASNTPTYESIVHTIANPDSSLYESAAFQSARENMLTDRFASVFIKPAPLLNSLSPGQSSGLGGFYDIDMPEWVVVAAGWRDEGILFNLAHPDEDDEILEPTAFAENPAAQVPVDTSFLLAVGFDPDIEDWRRALAEQRLQVPSQTPSAPFDTHILGRMVEGSLDNTDLVSALNLVLDSMGLALGIDMERDILAHLQGELFLALGSLRTDDAYPLSNATVGVSLKDEAEQTLERSITVAFDNLSLLGLNLQPTNIEGAITSWKIAENGRGIEPVVAITDGWLILSGSDETARSTAIVQVGGGESLLSDDAFRQAIELVGTPTHFLLHIDAREAVPQWQTKVDLSDSGRSLARDALGTLTISDPAGVKGIREYRGLLTLFPE